MQLCKPCQERGRETEATHTVAGELWCKWCFGGCHRPQEFNVDAYDVRTETRRGLKLMPRISNCMTCGAGITARAKRGLCSECSRKESDRNRHAERVRRQREMRAERRLQQNPFPRKRGYQPNEITQAWLAAKYRPIEEARA